MTKPAQSSYLAYALRASSLDDARALVEGALAVTFVEHDSSYKGGRYFRTGAAGRFNLIVQAASDEDGAPFEPGCEPDEWLLYVNDSRRPDEAHAALFATGRARLLWRKEL